MTFLLAVNSAGMSETLKKENLYKNLYPLKHPFLLENKKGEKPNKSEDDFLFSNI